MGNPFNNAALFLVQTVFDLTIIVVMLRLILQFQYADYFNPVVQFIVRLTNPLVKPLQRILPCVRRVDLAIVLLLLLLEFIKLTLIAWLDIGRAPHHLGIIIWTFSGLGNRFINIFFVAIILRVLLSWLSTNPMHPVSIILFQLTEPLLRPTRRLIPPIHGFDLSPLIVIIALKLTSIIVFWPFISLGAQIALR